jgi:tetratricopeptide (TPR) repeat protein
MSLPLSKKLFSASIFAMVSSSLAYGVLEKSPFWLVLDTPRPLCERAVNLDISSEAFFPIANEIVEKDDFNQLIATFRSQEWPKFDVEVRGFLRKFEKTQLRQVVEFLKVYSLYERLVRDDEVAERAADKALRRAILLYPDAKLTPIAYAAAGQYLLRSGQLQKGVELYRTAREKYAASEYTCLLDLGVLEGSYLLGEWAEVADASKQIADKCSSNFRIQALAALRNGEMAAARNLPNASEILKEAVTTHNPFAERFVPTSLFNLAELLYREKKFSESEFFFTRFLQASRNDSECGSEAQKRLGDIAFATHRDTATVAGRYLVTFERYGKTDAGLFSKAHALLLSAKLAQSNELGRRIKWIESVVDNIKDDQIRFRVYLEKGIVQWLAGDMGALGYLERMQRRKISDLREGEIGNIVRKNLIKYWNDHLDQVVADPVLGKEALTRFEQNYLVWMKGFEEDTWASRFYATLVSRLFRSMVEKDPGGAFAVIEMWKNHPNLPPTSVSDKTQARIGEAILHWQLREPEQSAVLLLTRRELLGSVLSDEYNLVEQLAKATLTPDELRTPAALSQNQVSYDKDSSSEYRLASAHVLMAQGKWKEARKALNTVDEKEWKDVIAADLLTIDLKEGKWASAFERMKMNLDPKAAPEANAKWIDAMASLCKEHKLLPQAIALLPIAKDYIKDAATLNRYHLAAGNAFAEQGKNEKAIEAFELALETKLPAPLEAEAHFRLGQALSRKKQTDAAKDHWRKVMQLQDPVWAPLAQNELTLVDSNRPPKSK